MKVPFWYQNQPCGKLWFLLATMGVLSPCVFLSFALADSDSHNTVYQLAVNPLKNYGSAIEFLSYNFDQLPEKETASNSALTVYAQYVQPTTKYNHNILGDQIEAEQLVVLRDGVAYTHTLGEQFVFEDIQPRLFDVDNDGQLEVITIRSHVTRGAGVMIYKIVDSTLTEFAWVEEIGIPYRWLNIAAIYDLDGDGGIELAWIQTPHIGGVLKIARIVKGKLEAISEISGLSNHAIGERNLCLSVVTKTNSFVTLYVPTQDRQQITGFKFTGESTQKTETIGQPVNFSSSLESQYDFSNVVQGRNLCLDP